jgi:hypothetical protein
MRCEQSAKATDPAEHLRPMRSPDVWLNLALQSIRKINVHARARVRFFHNVTL